MESGRKKTLKRQGWSIYKGKGKETEGMGKRLK